jgi:hypothetical protein
MEAPMSIVRAILALALTRLDFAEFVVGPQADDPATPALTDDAAGVARRLCDRLHEPFDMANH